MAAVFFNGPKVRVPKNCFRILTHPSVGRGTASRVRGTWGPEGDGGLRPGGPSPGFFPPAPPSPAFLLGISMMPPPEVVEEGGGPFPVTGRSLCAGRCRVDVMEETIREVPEVVLEVVCRAEPKVMSERQKNRINFPGTKSTLTFHSEMSADPSGFLWARTTYWAAAAGTTCWETGAVTTSRATG